ncbi:uncharacterized mitochondrial protein AtMg00810-like [Lathyrus oleraceus]|uniref:uncharacterized mitochondrial protein AtMg00810-like n=1 Tax=Pisum sativum TaxID=3888 RepID=UPI0021CDF244|nr:uncharacterized mitochondrial protein AtMg00810-like [Pisum sativum]
MDILEETSLLNVKPADTPMDPGVKLLPNQGEPLSDSGRYRRLVGKLNYLTVTRPDISFAVKLMKAEFKMGLVGELTCFLGLQVKQMDDSILISQSKHAKNIVKKFGMENASHKMTPAPTHLKLSKDEKGVDVDQSRYRNMIGSLLYLTASRPDITFVVGVCTRYQVVPKMSHINKVKRILKYINGTSDYDMLYSHGSNFILVGYYDTDWADSIDDRKCISGGCFFLRNNLISWFSKKQNCLSLSTVEDEYIAARSS